MHICLVNVCGFLNCCCYYCKTEQKWINRSNKFSTKINFARQFSRSRKFFRLRDSSQKSSRKKIMPELQTYSVVPSSPTSGISTVTGGDLRVNPEDEPICACCYDCCDCCSWLCDFFCSWFACIFGCCELANQ